MATDRQPGQQSRSRTTWLDELEPGAPDVVSAYRGIDEGRFLSVRREVRRRAGEGSAIRIATELAVIVDAVTELVVALPEAAFRAPGGEEDWNVAQALGHEADARAGLSLAGSLAAQGRFPPNAGRVVPGVPGAADSPRDALIRRLAASQRIVERSARAIAGHESDACPLDHPLVGRLRCGEWLLFAGVHDLMHLEQLHRLAGELAARREASAR